MVEEERKEHGGDGGSCGCCRHHCFCVSFLISQKLRRKIVLVIATMTPADVAVALVHDNVAFEIIVHVAIEIVLVLLTKVVVAFPLVEILSLLPPEHQLLQDDVPSEEQW